MTLPINLSGSKRSVVLGRRHHGFGASHRKLPGVLVRLAVDVGTGVRREKRIVIIAFLWPVDARLDVARSDLDVTLIIFLAFCLRVGISFAGCQGRGQRKLTEFEMLFDRVIKGGREIFLA